MSSLFLNGKRKRSLRKCQISLAIHPSEDTCASVVLTHEEGNFVFLFSQDVCAFIMTSCCCDSLAKPFELLFGIFHKISISHYL